jgi:hypothetical protein
MFEKIYTHKVREKKSKEKIRDIEENERKTIT